MPIGDYPEVREAGDRAFDVLREACEAVAATLPKEKRPPSLMMALHIWSLSHGIASLFGRGDAARRPIPMTPEDLLEAAVLIYLEGLGVPRISDARAHLAVIPACPCSGIRRSRLRLDLRPPEPGTECRDDARMTPSAGERSRGGSHV